MNNDVIRSNLEFINNKMDNLQIKISKTVEVCNNNHVVNSTNGNNILYSQMNNMMDKYYNIQNELMNKLNHEVKYIKYIGEQYYELDKQMKKEVDKL